MTQFLSSLPSPDSGEYTIEHYECLEQMEATIRNQVYDLLNGHYTHMDDMEYIVAIEQDRVLGVAAHREETHQQVFRVLKEIFVEQEERDAGIGSELIKEMDEISDAPKRLVLTYTNKAALRFYKRHGYEVTDEFNGQIVMEKYQSAE